MSRQQERLFWHSLVAAVLFGSFVVAPLPLLLREAVGIPAIVLGVALLAVGCSSLVGAALARGLDPDACTQLQWRFIAVSAWALNPVNVVCASILIRRTDFCCWSAVPLGAVVLLLTGRLQLIDGDPEWTQETCPWRPSLIATWLFSRAVFLGLPTCIISFQVALYLPESEFLPQGPEIGLFVCGGCVMISAKFCAMCAALARQQLSQALVLIILLSADWVSSLNLMEVVSDHAKTALLLFHLELAGLIQLRIALARMRLWQRLRSAWSGDTGARAVPVPGDSSDSDDEHGPGSLSGGFHQALLGVLGIPLGGQPHARRQFLCGVRTAVVKSDSSPPVVTTPVAVVALGEGRQAGQDRGGGGGRTVPSEPAAAGIDLEAIGGAAMPMLQGQQGGAAAGSAGESEVSETEFRDMAPPLEVPESERLCTVCQEEIATGDMVRPLPKCGHVFHADCLERWARTMRNETRCPTCRRPALAKRPSEGSVAIDTLSSNGIEGGDGTPRGPRRRSGGGSGEEGAGSGSSRSRQLPPARRPSRPSSARSIYPAHVTTLCECVNVSEALARAALEAANGALDAAAHLLLEHRTVLEDIASTETLPRQRRRAALSDVTTLPPPGLAEALVEANPHLAGMEAALQRQFEEMRRAGRVGALPWGQLQSAGQADALRAAMQDVSRRLEERA